METFETIFSRRSIRKYTADSVSDELITKIIQAGMQAPSTRNQQPWHFIVIKNREILEEIPKFHPYSKMLKEAYLAIVVCGDLKLCSYKPSWVIDCSAATENMLLAITALGLGAVWLGVYPREERIIPLKKLLNLPEEVIPLSIISIGYPAEEKPKENRFKPERIHYDKW